MQREIKRKTIAYGILAILLATTLGAVCLNFGIRPFFPPASAGTLSTFSSYEELENYLITDQKTPYYQLEISDLPTIVLPIGGVDVNTLLPRSGPEYSVTNVQVAGVDEADIVKTDGEYIYIASGNKVTILKAYSYPAEEAEILSQIVLNGNLRGVFINGDRLVIFEESYFYQPVEAYNVTVIDVAETNETTPLPVQQERISLYDYLYVSGSETSIKVYNVSNRANPLLTSEVAINGSYFSSRMIGDYVYAVTNQPTLWSGSRVILPTIIYLNETKTIQKTIQPTEIYYSNISDNSYAFTTIVALNIKLDAEPVQKTYLLGSASNMYASLNNIYMTMPKDIIYDTNWTEITLIHRVHIRDGEITSEASGEVSGRVLNQFSMDEYGEYFRIATTTGGVWGESALNHVYVLDMNLNIVGGLNLALGEQIHSTRFMGNRCYVVTFKKTDPLFVIDLSNPSSPKELGELHIPGYSDYLHPYDENHIIGIGKDTVEGEGGNFAWYQGVKISLFDVSDVENLRQLDNYIIGDRGSDSPVLTDHKAFLFDRSKNLLVMPVSVADINETEYPDGVPPWAYGDVVFQGAYVFDISLSGLVLRGRITHLENATESSKSGYYVDSSYYVERSLYIDNVLYTISTRKVKMNNLETLAEIDEITLL